MRRLAYLIVLVVLLTACQSQDSTPTVAAAPTTEPLSQGTASAGPVLFSGFDMMNAKSGWAWQGISRLFRTVDGGATWTEIHLSGKMLTAGAAFLSATEAWLPGPADAQITQGIYHTTDGGKTWTLLGRVHGPNVMLTFHDAKLGWATNGIGATGNVFYQVSQTTDGGQTWTQWQATSPDQYASGPVAGAVHTSTGDSLTFSGPDTMWVSSGHDMELPNAGLAVSRDAGKTWTALNLPLPAAYTKNQPPVNAQAPQFVSASDAYLPVTAGDQLLFFVSHDGGQTWQLQHQVLPSSQALPRVQFVNANHGFAACGSALCVTHDGAQSWEQVPAPFAFDMSQSGSYVVQSDFVDANTGWAIVADQSGQVLFVKTADGGKTWIDLKPRVGF